MNCLKDCWFSLHDESTQRPLENNKRSTEAECLGLIKEYEYILNVGAPNQTKKRHSLWPKIQATRGEIQLKHLERLQQESDASCLEDSACRGVSTEQNQGMSFIPSAILCTQIFSCSTTSEEAQAWQKYSTDLFFQHRKHALLPDTIKTLKLWKKR